MIDSQLFGFHCFGFLLDKKLFFQNYLNIISSINISLFESNIEIISLLKTFKK
jgi:hypothetical protein